MRTLLIGLVLLLVTAGTGEAGSPAKTKAPSKTTHFPESLLVQAKATPDQARAVALARIKGGRIRAEELENEGGKLVYSFDIAVPRRTGIDEVQVDAVTGKIVSVHHETPTAERKEKQAEKAEKAKSKTP